MFYTVSRPFKFDTDSQTMQQGALPPAPFVNGELLPRHVNTNNPVRIVGCLVDENASEVTIRTSDNKNVTVRTGLSAIRCT